MTDVTTGGHMSQQDCRLLLRSSPSTPASGLELTGEGGALGS